MSVFKNIMQGKYKQMEGILRNKPQKYAAIMPASDASVAGIKTRAAFGCVCLRL